MDVALLGLNLNPTSWAKSIFAYALHALEVGVEGVVSDVLGKVITSTTSVGLEGQGRGWFAPLAGALFPVEELVVAPLLFAATIGAIMRQDMRRLARAWLVCLPVSQLAGFAVVQLAALGLQVTDALSAAVQYQVAPNLGAVFLKVILVGFAASVSNGLLGLVMCGLFLAGALAIWLELAVRAASIELAIFFMPLALAGLVWPATAHWAKRMLELLAALLLAKPVIVGALCLGARALTGPALSGAIEGLAILMMAAFAPMAVLKLVPMVEASALSHLQGLSRAPFQAAERTFQRGMSLAAMAAAPGMAAAAGATGEAGAAGGVGGVAGHMMSQLGGAGRRGGGDAEETEQSRLGPAGRPPPAVGQIGPGAGADG